MSVEITDQVKGKSAVEVAQLLKSKGDSLQAKFADKIVEKDGQKVFNTTIAELEEYRKGHEELAEIGKAYDSIRESEKAENAYKSRMDQLQNEPVNAPVFPGAIRGASNVTESKSIGELFTATKEYGERKAANSLLNGTWGVEIPGISLKTTMSTSAGFAPANDRTSQVVLSAQRRPVIQNYISQVNVTVDSVKFMEETTFTNNAAATAEAASMTAAALAFTERSNPIELIGTYLPVTEQQLEIEEAVQGLINDRLMLMLAIKEEAQILSGSGTTPQLVGFYNKSGIQTQAKGADPTPDAIYKAFTLLRATGFVEPDLVAFHPNDWQDVRLLRDANGNYIWGNPAEAGPERIWGKNVLQTVSATEGTPLTGDFGLFSRINRKRGARIDVGYNSTDFIANMQTIKITSRLCLQIDRAAAFCTVTGV